MALNPQGSKNIADVELRSIYEMRDMAAELLAIKKNNRMDTTTKSNAALEVVNRFGLSTVEAYQQRVLELNATLQQRIHDGNQGE